MFSYRSPFCHLGTHQSLHGNLPSRPTVVPKHTFEAIHDRGSGIIRVELMLQHPSHRGKHVAMSYSIQFLPLVKFTLNDSRDISQWLRRVRSREDIYVILHSQQDVKITFSFNIVVSSQFILSENGGKWAKCRHNVSEKSFKQ